MSEPTLADLRDVHLPEPLPLWPLAPGWWLLLALIVIAACAFFGYRYWRTLAARRAALANLDRLSSDFGGGAELSTLFSEVSKLLKRVALRRFHKEEVASLYGEDWIAFLNRSGKQAVFSEELTVALARAPYDSNAIKGNSELESRLIDASRQWIQWNT